MKKKICLILPVYNNEGSLKLLYNRLTETLKKIKNCKYKLIFVDDGSEDRSKLILERISKSDTSAVSIFLSKNYGQATALLAGFNNANGDFIGTLDADLEDPPELINKMLSFLNDNEFDVVIAERNKTESSLFRKILSYTAHKLIRIGIYNYPKKGFNFWIMKKNSFKELLRITNGYCQFDIYKLDLKIKTILYNRNKSFNVKSQQNTFNLFTNFFEMIAPAIEKILKFFILFGILIFIFSFINIIIIIGQHFFLANFEKDLRILIVYISLFGGLNILMLGVLGIYLTRTKKDIPTYRISKIINNSK